MGDPEYHRGTLDYRWDDQVENIEFYYPALFKWNCIECGACCRDLEDRERRILLLSRDISRIEETGETDFYTKIDEGKFKAIMCKENGKCVFYTDGGCCIYEQRALLCRMYPFWLEKQDNFFIFGVDDKCPGVGQGTPLDEDFFAKLLEMALNSMDY
ncbi:hypothetical protein GF326_09495 [Candidatus Bathyarchaeota archaeon]|nr:hypothetical protein [Candidatus Bathyarchaeota archaeon]